METVLGDSGWAQMFQKIVLYVRTYLIHSYLYYMQLYSVTNINSRFPDESEWGGCSMLFFHHLPSKNCWDIDKNSSQLPVFSALSSVKDTTYATSIVSLTEDSSEKHAVGYCLTEKKNLCVTKFLGCYMKHLYIQKNDASSHNWLIIMMEV